MLCRDVQKAILNKWIVRAVERWFWWNCPDWNCESVPEGWSSFSECSLSHIGFGTQLSQAGVVHRPKCTIWTMKTYKISEALRSWCCFKDVVMLSSKKWMLYLTGSQCRDCRTGVMCSVRRVLETTQVVGFCIFKTKSGNSVEKWIVDHDTVTSCWMMATFFNCLCRPLN